MGEAIDGDSCDHSCCYLFLSDRSDGERDWCGDYGNIYPSGRKGQESGLGHNHGTGKEVPGKVMQ